MPDEPSPDDVAESIVAAVDVEPTCAPGLRGGHAQDIQAQGDARKAMSFDEFLRESAELIEAHQANARRRNGEASDDADDPIPF